MTAITISECSGAIRAIRDDSGLCRNFDEAPAWRMELCGSAGQRHELSSDCASFRLEDGGRLLHWECANGICVHVRIGGDGGGLSTLDLSVDNGSQWQIGRIDYPLLPIRRNPAEALIIPWQMGVRIPDPVGAAAADEDASQEWTGQERRSHQLAAEYPGLLAMQFMALECGGEECGNAVYFGLHDSSASYKRFGLYGARDCDSATMMARHFPASPVPPGGHWQCPYPICLGLFRGNWLAAAEIYRSWAIRQQWCRCGKVSSRHDLPSWAAATGVWYWNWVFADDKGETSQILPVLRQLQQKSGLPCAFHWYGWNNHCHDSDYPDYALDDFGRKRLKEALDQYHAAGVKVFPYVNGRLWNVDSSSWHDEQAGRHACLKSPERPGDCRHYHVESYADHPFVTMCPATGFWQQKVCSLVKRVLELGMDGAYIDQISSSFAVCCHNAAHGHERAGDFWYRGYLGMMRRIRQMRDNCNREALLTSESVVECYISCFDMFLGYLAALQPCGLGTHAVGIPLFAAVYGDYIRIYGTGTLAKEDDFYFGQALDIENAVLPSLQGIFSGDLDDVRMQERLEWCANRAKLRHRYDAWLRDARLTGLPLLTEETVPVQFGGSVCQTPAVRGSVWRNGDGSGCLIAVNHTDREQPITLPADGAWTNPDDRKPADRHQTMAPHSVRLWVE